MIRRLPSLALAVLLAGCATLDPPAPPQADPASLPLMNSEPPQGIDRWWTYFDDKHLDALIDEALAHNLDLQQAMARLEESRARFGLARAARYPGLDLAASAARNRATEVGSNPLPPGFKASTTDYGLTLDLSWEIDLWGRVAAASRSAGEAWRASQADTAGAQASVAATVARSWFQLRAIDAELALVQRILDGREGNLRLIEARNREGSSGKLELTQARAERDAAKTALPPLRQARSQAESAIAVLLGRTPKEIFTPVVSRDSTLDGLARTPAIPAGLDADLLARRPDVIAAEARLLAGEWQLREARAAFFPRISLTGLLGYESGELSDLVSTPARVSQVAVGAVQPLVGLASLRSARDVAAAQRDESALIYQAAINNAFRETHDALVAIREISLLETLQQERLVNLDETVHLARLRFDAGYSGYLEVLDSERSRDTAARDVIAARRDRLLAAIELYLALGGGWPTSP